MGHIHLKSKVKNQKAKANATQRAVQYDGPFDTAQARSCRKTCYQLSRREIVSHHQQTSMAQAALTTQGKNFLAPFDSRN
jgi:hypothetical protein